MSYEQSFKGSKLSSPLFTSTVGPQALGMKIQINANTDLPPVNEELVDELYRNLSPTNQWSLTTPKGVRSWFMLL